jgi:mono/diheme cytochrome c family protein
MLRRVTVAAIAVGLTCFVAGSSADAATNAQEQRGAYIVNDIGGCGDCHTPHDRNGPVRGKALMGADLPFAPIHMIPGWTGQAPRIAGLPQGFTRAEVAKLLQTGRKPDGSRPRPPMPQYRMSPADAAAVAAYLASLRT